MESRISRLGSARAQDHWSWRSEATSLSSHSMLTQPPGPLLLEQVSSSCVLGTVPWGPSQKPCVCALVSRDRAGRLTSQDLPPTNTPHGWEHSPAVPPWEGLTRCDRASRRAGLCSAWSQVLIRSPCALAS